MGPFVGGTARIRGSQGGVRIGQNVCVVVVVVRQHLIPNFFAATFRALSGTIQGGRGDLGPQKRGIAERFCHQKWLQTGPSPSSRFSNGVLKQRLRRHLPRGFILVNKKDRAILQLKKMKRWSNATRISSPSTLRAPPEFRARTAVHRPLARSTEEVQTRSVSLQTFQNSNRTQEMDSEALWSG